MVEIEIDGKTLQVEPGAMIIEVADKVGISIPRFCYHKKLSIAANCRMCLVEVEKAPKPLPACATPVTAGMKISTISAKAKEAQRSVMEFLLINHPLDCPICDQGGECELQDISLEYGSSISRFTEGKRSVKDDDLGSLIETEMTRCIQCTRCVRFGTEVAGIRELGATGRGENMTITTYVKHSMESELSGNIIDLCPVGALTSKPFRFKARAWELQQTDSIAPHDCIGSNIHIHTLRGKVLRVVPKENEKINEMWLSDRDRFSYAGLSHEDRLHKPLVKINGQWQETDWIGAFTTVVAGLNKVKQEYGAEQIAALASPNSTAEEFYLLQKLMRSLGSNNIDHRLQQTDVSDQEFLPLYPGLEFDLEELENQDLIFLIGSNIQREQPIAGHRIRKATLRGAQVISLNVSDYAVNFDQTDRMIISPAKLVRSLAGITKALGNLSNIELTPQARDLLQNIHPTASEQVFAELLKNNKNTALLLGALAQNHPEAATLRSLSQLIAKLIGAKIGYFTPGANSAGAWLAGVIPHRLPGGARLENPGLAANEALAQKLKAYLLLNAEPELDCANSLLASTALVEAEFVVALSCFKTEHLLQYANVILPTAAFSETAGTYVNITGNWQSFAAAANPPGEARPAWKILRVLANQLNIPGFEYSSAEEIQLELAEIAKHVSPLTEQWYCPAKINENNVTGLTRITEWPIYAVDALVRRSEPLQKAASNDPVAVWINPNLAERLQLVEGKIVTITQQQAQVRLPLIISSRIPDDCVFIPAGRNETAGLGSIFGAVEIHAE